MITITGSRAASASDVAYACSRVGFVARNNPADLQAKALAAGMQAAGPNQYSHPTDGSWILMDASGNVQRGVGGTQFVGIPGGRNARAAAPQPPPQPPPAQPVGYAQPSGFVARDNSRPGVPGSMRGYAIARVGLLNAQSAMSVCPQQGFQWNGSEWIHQDGSWVRPSGSGVVVGWKGHGLSELPYRNGSGWA